MNKQTVLAKKKAFMNGLCASPSEVLNVTESKKIELLESCREGFVHEFMGGLVSCGYTVEEAKARAIEVDWRLLDVIKTLEPYAEKFFKVTEDSKELWDGDTTVGQEKLERIKYEIVHNIYVIGLSTLTLKSDDQADNDLEQLSKSLH